MDGEDLSRIELPVTGGEPGATADSVRAAVHELTNAVAVLKLRLVLLERDSVSPLQARHMIALHRAVERAVASLERLRALSGETPAPGPGQA